MTAYYNEIDPYAAQWLRNLIEGGHIAPGDVDERSIVDVRADDLRGYAQCHFFAGIGGWSYALRLAGWPDDRPVWTGSCPCQPLSVAGQRQGHADERHLWPAFYGLIAERRPAILFGEQVASKDGREWFAAVRADLEACRYACGAADLCAASVGAPHIRQRLWFVASGQQLADAECGTTERQRLDLGTAAGGTQNEARERQRVRPDIGAGEHPCRLAHSHQGQRGRLADGEGRERDGQAPRWQQSDGIAQSGGELCELGVPDRMQPEQSARQWTGPDEAQSRRSRGQLAGPSDSSFWHPVEWLPCRDGKARPVEPGTFPLAYGIPARVGKLRAYGNAIVAPLAAEFIAAAGEAMTLSSGMGERRDG